jgi:hypothetical protein
MKVFFGRNSTRAVFVGISICFLILISATLSIPNLTEKAYATSTSTLTVNSIGQNGTTEQGFYIQIYAGGSLVASGYTPASFTLINGDSYTIEANSYDGYSLDYWGDTGSSNADRSITIESNTTLLAVYGYPTGSTPSSGHAYIDVNTMLPNGTTITGYYVQLWQGGTEIDTGYSPASFTVTSGQTYYVYVADYGNLMFGYWGEGNSSRGHQIMPTSHAIVNFTADYIPIVTASISSGAFEQGTSRNEAVVIINRGSFTYDDPTVALEHVVDITTNDTSYVSATLSSSVPVTITSDGGTGVVNLNVSVASDTPVAGYTVSGLAEFNNSLDLPFSGTIIIAPHFLNMAMGIRNASGDFNPTISAANQTAVVQQENEFSNYTITSFMAYQDSPATTSDAYWGGHLMQINSYPTMLANSTSYSCGAGCSSVSLMAINDSWTINTYTGDTVTSTQTGYNYSVYVTEQYSNYNVSITTDVSSKSYASHVDIVWSSSDLSDLNLGDALIVNNTSTLKQFIQGVLADVQTLSSHYTSSSNSTLVTLGDRYAETEPSINYIINNAPSSILNVASTSGTGTIGDLNIVLCILDAALLVYGVIELFEDALACPFTLGLGCLFIFVDLWYEIPSDIIGLYVDC